MLASIAPFPLLALPGATGNNTLLAMMETYRRDTADDPDQVFDLEYLLGATVDDPELEAEMRSYRKQVAKLPGEFFEIEAKLIKKLGGHGKENETEEATEEATEGNETEEATEEATECKMWHLGMNLNPSDGHIMDYLTGWHTGEAIGTPETALSKDFLDSAVWSEPANYIAIARHRYGIWDAVKVFKFSRTNISLLDRWVIFIKFRYFQCLSSNDW